MLPRNIFDCLPQRGSPDRTARDTKLIRRIDLHTVESGWKSGKLLKKKSTYTAARDLTIAIYLSERSCANTVQLRAPPHVIYHNYTTYINK